MSQKTKVAVCVITYRRPEGLRRLLEGLNQLTFDRCGEAPALELIVVDNDSSGPACAFCEEIRSNLNWPLRCFVEPRRGIPFARNTAVTRALEEGADFIAFIDDDEVPEPSWLDELLYVHRMYKVDVVLGPVLDHFTVPVAPWLKNGGFFGGLRHPTGHSMKWGWTSNVLGSSEVFEKIGKPFDERFALSGGSDRHFFLRVRRAGYRMVWANDALVHEWIPKSRANLKWLIQRRFRYGNTFSLLTVEFEPSIRTRATLAANACKYIVRNSVRLLLRFPQSLVLRPHSLVKIRKMRSPIKVTRPKRLVRPLLGISYGAGMLMGVAGKRYAEYKRTHSV